MYGPAVRCKRFLSILVMRSYINVSGLSISLATVCGSINSSNKITDLPSCVPHTLTRGTFGTELPRGGVSLRHGPDGLRRGVDRRFALTRRGSANFSCRGVTGPSG